MSLKLYAQKTTKLEFRMHIDAYNFAIESYHRDQSLMYNLILQVSYLSYNLYMIKKPDVSKKTCSIYTIVL